MEYDEVRVARVLGKWARGDRDAFQVGWVTVLEAQDAYDPLRGLNFESFALKRARVAMYRHSRCYRSAVTGPKKYKDIWPRTQSENISGDSFVENDIAAADGCPLEALAAKELIERLESLTCRQKRILLTWLEAGCNGKMAAERLRCRRQVVLDVVHEAKRVLSESSE